MTGIAENILKFYYNKLQVLVKYFHLKMLHAPAAERNKAAILSVLQDTLPKNQNLSVLEVASGTGQHVSHFAKNLPLVHWQPTELEQRSVESIQTFIDVNQLKNVKKPIMLDVTQADLPNNIKTEKFDAIYCANMIHISPWSTTLGLFSLAEKCLKDNGQLITYGPYAINGVLTPESNVSFDAGLRQQDPEWGVRDLKDLVQLGLTHKLIHVNSIDMPANNKIIVFTKKQ